MSASTSREVLQLYRKLLQYGKELKLTDQTYFRRRIRKEFKTNKDLTSEADIQFNIKVTSFINTFQFDSHIFDFLLLLFYFDFFEFRKANPCCNGGE